MRVLFAVHTGILGGAELALVDLLDALPNSVSPVVACAEGPLAERVDQLGIPAARIRGTAGSFRLHPVHTAQSVADILRDAVALRRVSERHDIDLVHANSTRAGLMAATSTRIGGPPALVHIHDCLPQGAAPDLVRRYLTRNCAGVLSVSQYALDRFLGREQWDTTAMPLTRVVHDAVDAERFDPDAVPRHEARAKLGIAERAPVLAIIGQITPLKGQREAICMLELLHRDVPDAQLLVVGEPKFVDRATRLDNQAYQRSLRRLVADRGLEHAVRFLGHRSDIEEILAATDIVLAPSWEEGFGRVIIEAMAMRLPVIATEVGGPSEVIRDGVDGLLRPPRNPGLWSQAALELLRAPDARIKLGHRARETVTQRFTHHQSAEQTVDAYRAILGQRSRRDIDRPVVAVS